jgi:hypothetical protein
MPSTNSVNVLKGSENILIKKPCRTRTKQCKYGQSNDKRKITGQAEAGNDNSITRIITSVVAVS